MATPPTNSGNQSRGSSMGRKLEHNNEVLQQYANAAGTGQPKVTYEDNRDTIAGPGVSTGKPGLG